MVEKRGSVGETVFHVCFLMQTPTHLALGRRLLKWYPKLINDVYLSEEYYGTGGGETLQSEIVWYLVSILTVAISENVYRHFAPIHLTPKEIDTCTD